LHVFTGNITLLVGCSEYPSRWLKSYAIFIRALYSLMRSGLHGEKGLDPVTSISILRTYVIPIMFYGLETLLPSGKSFETLD
jgi:hypothetical protein